MSQICKVIFHIYRKISYMTVILLGHFYGLIFMGVIPIPKMALIFPISCTILALIFPIIIKYFPKFEAKGSFLKYQIKSLHNVIIARTKVVLRK